MAKPIVFRGFSILFILLLSGCHQGQFTKTSHPNIIFILVDDMGYGDLGVLYQNQRAKENNRSEPWEVMPNLDRMAKEGAILTDQYCAAPVCAPSRASLLTGRSQGHANVRDNQFDKALEDNFTLATVLQEAGYATAAFGKWGLQGKGKEINPPDWPAHPLNRGFDYFLGYMRHRDGHEHYPKEGLYRGKKEVWENRTNIADSLDKCYTADLWTAAAKRWIVEHTKHKKRQPFFIYLAYDTPHAVLELPTQAYPPGGGLKGGLQWSGQPGHMINTASGTIDSYVYPEYASATWDDDHDPATPEVSWPKVYQRYATATRRIDDAVGDIIQLLKDLKIDDKTLIVFSSDNGPSRESYLPKEYRPNNPSFFRSFGPFDGIKRDCWEGGVRMPVLARWPGHIAAGKQISLPSSLYDWLPTFAEMAGLPPPALSDGVSLLPALTGKGTQSTPLVYIEYTVYGKTPDYPDFAPQHRNRKRGQMQVIRMGDYLGVRYNILSPQDDFEIYDVTKDPQELNNLAGHPDFTAMQKKMKARVLQVRIPNPSAPRPYDTCLVPAVHPDSLSEGISWDIYNGIFPWIPDEKGLIPDKTGTGNTSRADMPKKIKKGMILYHGYLKVPAGGSYTFYLNTSTNALLRIHDIAVIDAGYGYQPGTECSTTVHLQQGLHPFRLYLLQPGREKPVLQLSWSGPGMPKQPVPASLLFH